MSRRPVAPTKSVAPAQSNDIERRVDELTRTIQSMVELKTGFAEDHVKSRALQKIFSQFDIDHTGKMTVEEFCKVLEHLNVAPSKAEMEKMFDRYDSNESGDLSFKEFSDAVFGLAPQPLADPAVRDVLGKFQDKIMARARAGDEGVARGLTRCLVTLDTNGSGTLTKEELQVGLSKYGMKLEEKDLQTLMKAYDRDGSGSITITELLRGVRGKLPLKRRQLIMMAYKTIDKNGDESVTLAELQQCYRAEEHPAVKKGTRTVEDVIRELMSAWDKDHGDSVSWEEFLDYYKDISAAIDLDDYFELMMRNAWHISGGEGW
eukprot:PhF_6_TR41345/c0_g1_i3/m.62746